MDMLCADNGILTAVLIMAAFTLVLNAYVVLRIYNKNKPEGGKDESVKAAIPSAEGLNAETVAAITAAVAVLLEKESAAQNKPRAGFIVKSIKKQREV